MDTAIVARDMMTTKLVTLRADMDVFDAIDTLLRKRISGAPVLDAHKCFLGIFSESSCMKVVLNAAYDGLPRAGLLPFIDTNPPTILPDTDILSICQTFLDQSTRRLPVLEEGRLIGQVSRRDVMRRVQGAMSRSSVSESNGSDYLYFSALGHDRQSIAAHVK